VRRWSTGRSVLSLQCPRDTQARRARPWERTVFECWSSQPTKSDLVKGRHTCIRRIERLTALNLRRTYPLIGPVRDRVQVTDQPAAAVGAGLLTRAAARRIDQRPRQASQPRIAAIDTRTRVAVLPTCAAAITIASPAVGRVRIAPPGPLAVLRGRITARQTKRQQPSARDRAHRLIEGALGPRIAKPDAAPPAPVAVRSPADRMGRAV